MKYSKLESQNAFNVIWLKHFNVTLFHFGIEERILIHLKTRSQHITTIYWSPMVPKYILKFKKKEFESHIKQIRRSSKTACKFEFQRVPVDRNVCG